MNRNLYLEIRRLVNVVRLEKSVGSRLVFDEFATMCVLLEHGPMRTTELAVRMDIAGPTMAHRSNHMSRLGLIERREDPQDRRCVLCSLSEYGRFVTHDTLGYAGENLARIPEFSHVGLPELTASIALMGRLPMTADSLVLFCFAMRDAMSMTVRHIVHATAMLQPTVSMAVLRLENEGLIERAAPYLRGDGRRPLRRASGCVITALGMRHGKRIVTCVEEL